MDGERGKRGRRKSQTCRYKLSYKNGCTLTVPTLPSAVCTGPVVTTGLTGVEGGSRYESRSPVTFTLISYLVGLTIYLTIYVQSELVKK